MSARAESIPFDDYRKAEGINGSWLKEMARSPKHFQAYSSREDKPTEPMIDGRHTHTCVLELALYEATTCTYPGGPTADGKGFSTRKGTNHHKAFVAQKEAEGREVLSTYKDWLYRRIREAVLAHEPARRLIECAQAELSVFWTHPIGLAMKSRLDLLDRTAFVADLKTCADITPEGFGRAAFNMGYGVQAALYVDAAKALTGKTLKYYIIACEKTEPFDVAVYEVGEDIIAMGRAEYCRNLRRVKECRESDEWPGVVTGVQALELPQWAYEDIDDVLDWTGVETATA
jgi:hypothetical protein